MSPFVAWLLSACLLCPGQSARTLSTPRPAPEPSVAESSVTPSEPAPSSAESPIRIGPVLLTGYAQFDGLFPLGEHGPLSNGTFRIRRARVYASGDLAPKIGFTLSADALASPVPLLDAYLALKYVDAANIRVGQFIAPYSLERLTSTKYLEAIDRVLDGFVPSRDMGVMVFNNTPFWGRVSYSAAVINGTGQNVRDTNDAKDVVGRLVTLVPGAAGISVGVNGQAGRQVGGMRKRWGADLNFDRGNYHVMAEYLHETRDIWQGLAGHGFYVLATRRFHPETQRAGFYMAEAVLRLSETRDPSPLIADGTAGARLRQVQAGGNYYFSHNVRVMADAGFPIRRAAGAPRATIITRLQFIF